MEKYGRRLGMSATLADTSGYISMLKKSGEYKNMTFIPSIDQLIAQSENELEEAARQRRMRNTDQ